MHLSLALAFLHTYIWVWGHMSWVFILVLLFTSNMIFYKLLNFPERQLFSSLKQNNKKYLPLLVSQGCHNKVPQSWGLETTEIYSIMVLDSRNVKLGVGRIMLSLKALGEDLSLPLEAFSLLVATGSPQCALAYRCFTLVSVFTWHSMYLCISIFPFYGNTSQDQGLSYSTVTSSSLITSTKSLFLIRSHSEI